MQPSHSNLLSDDLNDSSLDDGFIDPELMLEQTLADPDLVQHVVRTKRDGAETIVGYFRCEFAPGQQRHVLHVPFMPAMATVPAIEAMVTEESSLPESVRVRVTDQQRFGGRMEIVLPEPAVSALSVLVEVIAHAAIVTD